VGDPQLVGGQAGDEVRLVFEFGSGGLQALEGGVDVGDAGAETQRLRDDADAIASVETSDTRFGNVDWRKDSQPEKD